MAEPTQDLTHAAYHCGHCGSDLPWWYILREGDVVVSWACYNHLPEVCDGLQRVGRDTRLIVTEHKP